MSLAEITNSEKPPKVINQYNFKNMNIECPICTIFYDTKNHTPTVLTCGHSLCQLCVRSLPQKRCPTCQKQFNEYSKNFTLIDVINSLSKMNLEYQALYKICIVGESMVGKTSIMNSFAGDRFQENTTATIGLGFRFINEMHNGKAYKFELWDTAGQEKFRAITKSYYVKSDIVLITYSLSDSGSFEEATKFWLEEVKAYAPNAIIVLLGNKQDEIRAVSDQKINKVIDQSRIFQAKLSCKNGHNVRQIWKKISATLRNRNQNDKKTESSKINIEKTPLTTTKQESKCCKS